MKPIKSPREKNLIETFPYEAHKVKARQIWKRQKVSDSTVLMMCVIGSSMIGLLGVVGVLLLVPYGLDTSPLTPLIILGVGSSVLFFDVRKRAVMGYKELGRKIKYH